MNRREFIQLASSMGLLLQGCTENGAEPPQQIERFGLVAAPEHQPLVAGAIATANLVLNRRAGFSLLPGWASTPRGRDVPVYATRSEGLGRSEVMAAYRECSCIIVNLAALGAWRKATFGENSASLAIDDRYLLAYMLLHEAGHIIEFNSDPGKPSRAPADAISIDRPLNQKDREQNADAFAAAAIIEAQNEFGTERGLAAGWIAMSLTKISWNLSAHRLLDDFGGTILEKKTLFNDRGLSHPNLEWRILTTNNLIARTDVSRQLLEDFENMRFNASKNTGLQK